MKWRKKEKMRKIKKKIVGGLMATLLVATFGAALVSAESDDASDNIGWQEKFWHNSQSMCGEPSFISELTIEQRQELDDLVENLKDEGAIRLEIRDAISSKLEEFGVEIHKPEFSEEELDEILVEKIEHTEQRLEILYMVKELRNQGYSYEEISEIINNEFDQWFPKDDGYGKMYRYRYRREAC